MESAKKRFRHGHNILIQKDKASWRELLMIPEPSSRVNEVAIGVRIPFDSLRTACQA